MQHVHKYYVDYTDIFLPHESPQEARDVSGNDPGKKKERPDDGPAAEFPVDHQRHEQSHPEGPERNGDRVNYRVPDGLIQPEPYGAFDIYQYIVIILEPDERRKKVPVKRELVKLEERHVKALGDGQ